MAASANQRADELRHSVSSVTQRVEEIIAGAEKDAERTRAEAEAEGQRYLNERREEADRAVKDRVTALREVTEEIVNRSEQVGRGAEALAGELRSVLPKLRALIGGRGGGREAAGAGKGGSAGSSSDESEEAQ